MILITLIILLIVIPSAVHWQALRYRLRNRNASHRSENAQDRGVSPGVVVVIATQPWHRDLAIKALRIQAARN